MYFSATFLKIRTTHETSQYYAKQDTLKYIVNIGKCVLLKVKVHSLQNFHCDSLGTTSLKTVMSKHFRWGSSLIEDWVSMKSVIVARCKWKLIAVACTSHSVIYCYWRWFFFIWSSSLVLVQFLTGVISRNYKSYTIFAIYWHEL